MHSQTISLFRFLMLGILSKRLLVLVVIMMLAAVFSGSFINELAIIKGDAIQAAFIADFLRYSLALLALLMIATSVAEDYEFRQFERLLTMPLARWQYIAAQTMVIACLCLLFTLPVTLLISFYDSVETGLYWGTALWMELFLLGLLGLLAILSLEKIPQAIIFSLAIYLLAKFSGLISVMLVESIKLSEGSVPSRVVEFIFNAILYVIPGSQAFAENDVFFASYDLMTLLGTQFVTVLVYSLFLLVICLVDFYRKEFNL